MGSILVAAGGGGDAITCAALSGPLGLSGPSVILTFSWERLMIDPLPGPRSAADFDGLSELSAGLFELTSRSAARPPAGSSLPRLAAELSSRIFLLDPSRGAIGMAEQIGAAARAFGAADLVVVDVGGDSLAVGGEPGLRSPLADQLAIAACLRSELPARLLVAGPAIDGELDTATVTARLKELHADRLTDLTAEDLAPVRNVFRWHPSEASGLLAAAAEGRRGYVEVRDAGDQVPLTDDTAGLHVVELDDLAQTGLATAITETDSLSAAEAKIDELTGISEIRYETAKANRRIERPPVRIGCDHLPEIDRHASEAAARGADYISMRRLSELIGANRLDSYAELGQMLQHERPDRYATALYRVN